MWIFIMTLLVNGNVVKTQTFGFGTEARCIEYREGINRTEVKSTRIVGDTIEAHETRLSQCTFRKVYEVIL